MNKTLKWYLKLILLEILPLILVVGGISFLVEAYLANKILQAVIAVISAIIIAPALIAYTFWLCDKDIF